MTVITAKDQTEPVSEGVKEVRVDSRDPLATFLHAKLHMHWVQLWLVALLYFGFLEKIIVPYLLNILNIVGVGLTEWVPHVEAMLTGFVEFPIFLGFYLWSGRGVVVLFESMSLNENFRDQDRYRRFVDKVYHSMRSPWLPILGLISSILAVCVMHFVIWGPNAILPPWFGGRILFRAWSLFNIGFVSYAVAQVIFRQCLVIYWLDRLWRSQGDHLVIHPYHADGAGGLGSIGKYAVTFFFFVLALLLFLVMAIVIPEILSVHPEGEGISFRFWSPVILVASLLYLVLIPFMFFLLIWPAQQAMQTEKDKRLSIYSKQLNELINTAEDSLAEERKKLPGIYGEIENLKKFRSVILNDYPVWPLGSQQTRIFGITSSIPTIYSALAVIVRFFL